MYRLILGTSMFVVLASISAMAASSTPTTRMTAPGVQVPTVLPPKTPNVSTPVVAPATNASNGAATANSPPVKPSAARGQSVATTYTESAFKTASTSGAVVVLLFGGASDTIWTKQAAILQTVLQEPEFRNLTTMQADVSDTAVTEQFGVAYPGTILLLKEGAERVRSTRMIEAEVIRKMLRLSSAL